MNKKVLILTIPFAILSMLILSCSDNKEVIINDNEKDTLVTEIKDYWDDSNFKPLNDEFNDFREFQAGLLFPYNLSNSRVQNYLKNPNFITKMEISTLERQGKSYLWFEVSYPKNDPSKAEFAMYHMRSPASYLSKYFFDGYNPTIDNIPDSIVFRTRFLFKDKKLIAAIEHFPHGKHMINIDNHRTLLYDFNRIAFASNKILYCNDTTNTRYIYSYEEVKDEINNSSERLDDYYFSTDQYGGKVLGSFGSLTSFLLPINGPSSDDMIQEVVGLREGTLLSVIGIRTIFNTDKFIYKNINSPAAPFLPDSIFDLEHSFIVEEIK